MSATFIFFGIAFVTFEIFGEMNVKPEFVKSGRFVQTIVGHRRTVDQKLKPKKFKQTVVNLYEKLSPRTAAFGGIHNGVHASATKMIAVYGGNASDRLGATLNAYTMGMKHNF
jgi:hypothetical protein